MLVVTWKKVVSIPLKKATPLTKALWRNKWLNSRTRGLWWVWLCLFAVSGGHLLCLLQRKLHTTHCSQVDSMNCHSIDGWQPFWHDLGSDGREMEVDWQPIQIDRLSRKQQLTIIG
jgi:hypothetical protein